MNSTTTVCVAQTGASGADAAAALEASAGAFAAAQGSGPRARPRALPAEPDRLAPGSVASYAVSLLRARPAPRPRKKPTTTTTTTTSLPAELSFLKDPKMSVQEKVFRLLLYFQQKYDKEVEAKMAAYTGKTKTTTSSSSGRSAAKSAFARAFGVMKAIVPGLAALENPAVAKLVKQLSGPVLAAAVTALGHPELAAIVAKFAPQVLGALADGAQEQARSNASASSSSTGSSSSSSSSSSSEADEKKLAAELQWAMERQQAMTGMLSAVLKSMHETNMDVIHNIR